MTERDERDERDIFQGDVQRGAERRKADRRKAEIIKTILKYLAVAIAVAVLFKLLG
jgi:hypothetical protein